MKQKAYSGWLRDAEENVRTEFPKNHPLILGKGGSVHHSNNEKLKEIKEVGDGVTISLILQLIEIQAYNLRIDNDTAEDRAVAINQGGIKELNELSKLLKGGR
ncbi:hypothetical protein KKE60_05995 [Patescibacteria group bacterium]|nr:hypothetical protein [Patescibacteria group bacterium]